MTRLVRPTQIPSFAHRILLSKKKQFFPNTSVFLFKRKNFYTSTFILRCLHKPHIFESGVGFWCPSSSTKQTAWWPFSWRHNLSSGTWTLFRGVSAQKLTAQARCLSAGLSATPLCSDCAWPLSLLNSTASNLVQPDISAVALEFQKRTAANGKRGMR